MCGELDRQMWQHRSHDADDRSAHFRQGELRCDVGVGPDAVAVEAVANKMLQWEAYDGNQSRSDAYNILGAERILEKLYETVGHSSESVIRVVLLRRGHESFGRSQDTLNNAWFAKCIN